MLWHIFPCHAMLPMLCHICGVMAHTSCYGTYSAGERASEICAITPSVRTCPFSALWHKWQKKYVPQRTLQWVMAQMSCRNHSVSACIQYNVIIDLNAWIYKYARKCQSLRVVAAPATNRCGWIYGYMRAPAMKILCLLPVYRRAYTPINTRIRLHISLCRPV